MSRSKTCIKLMVLCILSASRVFVFLLVDNYPVVIMYVGFIISFRFLVLLSVRFFHDYGRRP